MLAQATLFECALQGFGRSFAALLETRFVTTDEHMSVDFPEFRHLS
jgi:hypothetical protein